MTSEEHIVDASVRAGRSRPRPRLTDARVVAAIAAAGLVVGIYLLLAITPELWVDRPVAKASSPRWRIATALADSAVMFLSATLAIGPLRVLRGGRPAVHLPWRRVLGVTGALLAAAHVLVALTIHGSLLRFLHQFFVTTPSFADPFTVRRSVRGYANWVGLAAISVLLVLAFVSRSSWLRRLGSRRWKLAQRSIYLAFAAIALHAFLYWRVEQRLVPHQVLVLTPIALAASLQLTAAAVTVGRGRSAPELIR